MKEKTMYVIAFDNGSGYYEWNNQPQETEAAAWKAAGLEPGTKTDPATGLSVRLEKINDKN